MAIVRVLGIPRSAATLDVLSGSFRVVASEKLLAVEFKELTSDKPATQTIDGVKVALQPVKRQSHGRVLVRVAPRDADCVDGRSWPTRTFPSGTIESYY